MIVLIAHTKGGVGKTLLASNLAALFVHQGVDLMLVDADHQGTASAWCELRRQSHPEVRPIRCCQLRGKLHRSLPELEERFELLLVDAGGYDSVELRSSLLVADLHLLPLPPAAYALWALDDLEPLREQAAMTNTGLSTLAVLNRAQRHYLVRDAEDARGYLEERGLSLARTVVHERRVFRRSESEGLAVPELRPRDAAGSYEIQQLFRELCDAISDET